MTLARPMRRWHVAMGGAVAALVLLLVLGTPRGRDAGAQFLAQFRNEQLEAVTLSTGQIANVEATLAELAHLGSVEGLDTAPAPRGVASIAEASQFAGFDVLQPDPAALPDGIGSTPAAIRVVPGHELRFTFDVERARAYYASVGRGDVTLPERFDGVSLIVRTPPAVLLEYRREGAPVAGPFGAGMIVGQAGTVTASVTGGVTLDELQEFLLELPGLDPETVRQLQDIEEWQTTLPVPIPVDEISWERATIAGSPGLLLDDNSGLGSAALWQRDGRIFGIAGAMKARELQRVADALR